MFTNLYTGLSQIRTYFDFIGAEGSSTNNDIREILARASRLLDIRTKREFYPRQEELWFDLPEDRYNLRFPRWEVFEILELADYQGGSPIPNSIIHPRCGNQYNMTPYTRLSLAESSGSSFNSNYRDRAIKMTCSVGFEESWKNNTGWIESGTCLAVSTGSGGSVLDFVGGSGQINSIGDWPRFYSDQIIRVKSGSAQEIMYISDTDFNASSQIGVVRGMNKTSASTWASGVIIETWYPPIDIVQATLRLSAWLWKSRTNPQHGRTVMPAIGQMILQDNIPEDVVDIIKDYTRFEMGSYGK